MFYIGTVCVSLKALFELRTVVFFFSRSIFPSSCYYTVLYICYTKVFGVNINFIGQDGSKQRKEQTQAANYKKEKKTHCRMRAHKHDNITCF